MGADFIGIAVPITRTREEALAKFRELSFDEIITRLGEGSLIGMGIENGLYDLESYDEETGLPELDKDAVISECVTMINIAYDTAEGRLRGAGYIRVGECDFALAAGMSWGDPPEFYDELEVAYALGVTYDDTKTLKWVE